MALSDELKELMAYEEIAPRVPIDDEGNTLQKPIACAAADVHAPGSANTAAVITFSASAGNKHVITGVAWSYSGSGTLSGGELTIEDGSSNIVFDVDVTDKGPGFILFPRPKRGSTNTDLIITLAAGGTDVTGKINVLNHWTEEA